MKSLSDKEADVVDATFWAISSAMGWDRERPLSLYQSVLCRIRKASIKEISDADEILKDSLHA